MSFLRHSSEGRDMSSFARPIHLLCSISRACLSWAVHGDQTTDPSSNMGLTIDLYSVLILFLSNCVKQRFTRPEILFACVHTLSTCFLGFKSFDTMIPRSFCSFSSFSGVLFKLYVKLVFGLILNTAHLLALKFMCHVLDHALSAFRSYWRSWHSVRSVLLLNNFVSSAKSLTLVLQYSGMSFTKIRKSTGPDIVPCGTPDTTCDHADICCCWTTL